MQFLNLHEYKLRGTADFPLEFHHVDYTHSHYMMNCHWHEEFEIIRVLEGQFVAKINEETIIAESGDSIFIPGGCLHSGVPNNCVYECIVFDLRLLLKSNDNCKKYIHEILQQNLTIFPFCPSKMLKLHKVIWNLFDALAEKKDGSELIAFGNLFVLFGVLFEQKFYKSTPLEVPRNVKKVIQLKTVLDMIEKKYACELTLTQLSQSVGMSPKYFCRFFAEMTHRTPIDYLNYYRIDCACHLLNTTDHTITNIAFECGFNDVSHFIKTFKKYKGYTPKKYITLLKS